MEVGANINYLNLYLLDRGGQKKGSKNVNRASDWLLQSTVGKTATFFVFVLITLIVKVIDLKDFATSVI